MADVGGGHGIGDGPGRGLGPSPGGSSAGRGGSRSPGHPQSRAIRDAVTTATRATRAAVEAAKATQLAGQPDPDFSAAARTVADRATADALGVLSGVESASLIGDVMSQIRDNPFGIVSPLASLTLAGVKNQRRTDDAIDLALDLGLPNLAQRIADSFNLSTPARRSTAPHAEVPGVEAAPFSSSPYTDNPDLAQAVRSELQAGQSPATTLGALGLDALGGLAKLGGLGLKGITSSEGNIGIGSRGPGALGGIR